MAMRHGRVKTFGSSIVTSYQITSGDLGVKRSTRCSASLWKLPARSNQLRSLKLVTLTTSVSPSQWPTEWPIQVSSGGPSTLSMWIVRAVLEKVEGPPDDTWMGHSVGH